MSENTLFITESPVEAAAGSQLTVGLDDLILTQGLPTSAGSKMLEGFKSLFAARACERLQEAGCAIAGKVNVGEFGFDFLGETSYFGPVVTAEGQLTTATSQLLAGGSVDAVVGLDVNGAQARAAALSGQVHLKPTYGCVSRFGTVAVACSGETVDISARSAEVVQQVLDMLAAHDDADGTSLPESECARLKSGGSEVAPITQVKVARGKTDVVVFMRDAVYVMELKMRGTGCYGQRSHSATCGGCHCCLGSRRYCGFGHDARNRQAAWRGQSGMEYSYVRRTV